MKQDESNGDLKFTVAIGCEGKIVKSLKDKQNTILEMERSMWDLQKSHIGI